MVLSACLEVVVQLSSDCSVVKHGMLWHGMLKEMGTRGVSGLRGYTHKHISGFLEWRGMFRLMHNSTSSPFRVAAERLPRARCHPHRQRHLCWWSMECFPSDFKRGECAKCCQGTWRLCVSASWTRKVNKAFDFQLLHTSLGVSGLQFLYLGLPANEKQVWWKTAFPGLTEWSSSKQHSPSKSKGGSINPPHVLWDEAKTFFQNKGEMRLKTHF